MSRKAKYDEAVTSRASSMEPASDIPDLASLVRFALSEPIDKPTFIQLLAIQSTTRERQQRLVNQLEAHEITSDEYLSHTEALVRDSLVKAKLALGERRYKAVFGDKPVDGPGLIDRETFHAQDLGFR